MEKSERRFWSPDSEPGLNYFRGTVTLRTAIILRRFMLCYETSIFFFQYRHIHNFTVQSLSLHHVLS